MPEVTNYIILFQGRAGSTFLTEHMGSHPEIRAKYEEFSGVEPDWDSQLNWMIEFFFNTKRGRKVKAVGFKTKFTSIADKELFAEFIEDHDIKVIHLYRRNLAKLIVSIIRADELRRRYGDSNLFQGRQQLGKIRINPDDFHKYKCRSRIYRELRDYVDALKTDVCRANYEQLIYKQKGTLNRIWDFLGVERVPTEAKVRKNTPDRLEDAVENLEELRSAFPEYEKFFSEDLDPKPTPSIPHAEH